MADYKQTKGRTGKMGKEDLDKVMNDVFEKGILPKDAMGLTNEMVEGIYGHSYRLYNAGQYREASQLFRLLIMLNATEPKYVLGLAACYHLMGQYDNAVITYAVVEVMNPTDPMPSYHSSDCYLKLGLPEMATDHLQSALKKCGDRSDYRMLKDRILMTLGNLSTKSREEPKDSEKVSPKKTKST